MNSSTFTFPKLIVPEGEKNKDWYKKFVQAIINRSIADGYANRRAIADECVNFYLGLQTGEEFDFLQKAEDGDVLPAQWINFNKINTKINLLIGELAERGYDISVTALNKEARVRKLEEKERLRMEMRFSPIAQELEGEFGLPIQSNESFIPQDEEELDDYIDKDYREISEIVMEFAIKYLTKRNRWDYTRIALFRDLMIMNMAFVRNEVVSGIPTSKRVDPRNMVWDTAATDDFLTDATFFGEFEYMSIGDVVDRFNISEKEIKEVYQSYTDYLAAASSTILGANDFSVIDKSNNLRFFKTESGGDLRVLVVRACWVDYKKLANKVTHDSYGNEHIEFTHPDNDNERVQKKLVQVWRQATLIGGKVLKEWGEMPNQTRSIDSLAYTEPPYKALIPNYLNGVAVSKVQQLKGLQKLKDITMYNIQLAMARAGTKGIFYDIAQLPEDFDINRAMKYLKSVGIAFIDSNANGNGSTFNQFKEFDMTLSDSVKQYLDISMMIDREMDMISGINEARQGIVQRASQAVGVTQSALLQSNLSTALYFRLFSDFCSRVLNYQAKLVKIVFPKNKDKFASIIGDAGINFLETDVDLDLNDYGVFVEEHPPIIQDSQNFQQIVIAALQAGQLTFYDAMKLLMERDIKAGVRKLERSIKQQQQMMQEQQEALMQQEQERAAAEQQAEERKNEVELMKEQMKTEAGMKQLLAQGRIDLKNNMLDFRKDVALAKMQKDIQKQKDAAKKR